MPAWSRIVRNYFTFNRRERRGVYVLVILIIILSCIHLIIRLSPVEKTPLTKEELAAIEAFNVMQIAAEQDVRNDKDTNAYIQTEIVWYNFDPNQATVDEYVEFGLDSSIAKRIDNYRVKGGQFRTIQDLSKIYDLPESWLEDAKPFLIFPEKEYHQTFEPKFQQQRQDTAKKEYKRSIPIVELNTADSATLVKIPWIGPFYAKEIVKLRTGLGGFISYDQLLDIYMIRDEAIQSLVEHSKIDKMKVVKININSCDVETLGKHPYLTWKEAKTIVNYRFHHGNFKHIERIKDTDIISDSVYLKIAPYLTIE